MNNLLVSREAAVFKPGRLRRTKIVTTLGPATDRGDTLEQVINAGANVVRLNFSHGSAEEHLARAQAVRAIAHKLNRHVAILGDLQGPKIRIACFRAGTISLSAGDRFTLDTTLENRAGDNKRVGLDYKKLPAEVQPKDILLLDDGRIQLRVEDVTATQIVTAVTIGGQLSNNKGINKLGGGLSAAALTEKDKRDIVTAAKIGVDYLAVSFPRNGRDLQIARQLARQAGSDASIVAKVERAESVASQAAMDDLILAADVVMVARGDLGVEIGDAELMGIQKALIRRARQLNRTVITATQMMESMIENAMPTRAEVMDVANAVLDGTDAVMLSAETATGHYPVATVQAMANVCLGAERVLNINAVSTQPDILFASVEEAIAMSAVYTANHLNGVAAIITLTESGQTPLMASRVYTGLPVFALSRHTRTLNLTALYRGVTPLYFANSNEGVAAAVDAIALLRADGYLTPGELVIVTQGDVMGTSGATNTSRILQVS